MTAQYRNALAVGAAVALAVGLAAPAGAGITDPLVAGGTLIYAFNGVEADNSAPDDIATEVVCTNLDPANSIRVRVEFFLSSGAFSDAHTSTLRPGETAAQATDAIVGRPGTFDMNTPNLSSGSGRIVAIGRRPNVKCIARLVVNHDTEPHSAVLPLMELGRVRVRVQR